MPESAALAPAKAVNPDKGSTIDLYLGDFLISPIPLEMSLNWCSHACHMCSHVDQPITLYNLRTIPAGSIKVGDELLGWDRTEPATDHPPMRPGVSPSRYRKWTKTVVTNVFHRRAPVQRVTMANGESVVCTPDHYWYTGRGGKIEYAKATKRKGRKLYRVELDLLPVEALTEAYMIGYIRGVMEGDGAYLPQKAWRIAMKDPEPLARIASYVLLMGMGHFDARPYEHSRPDPDGKWSPMQQLYFPTESPVNDLINGLDLNDRNYWRGWLAGIYDAEGNTPARLDRSAPCALRINQVQSVNPLIHQRIERALRLFGFGTVAEDRAVRVVGGRLESARFCQLVQPAIERKKNPLEGSTLKGIEHSHALVDIEPLGYADVASFETTTHNYVSGGYMSRNCFANLGNPERTANVPGIMAQLARVPRGKGLDSLLMRSGYPVLISNRVDPFANSNYKQALPIMETMTEQGIPFTIQTRGGRGIDEVLAFAPPSVWYVSVCTLDDVLRKELEPGAPTTESRFDLIQRLKEAGHRVVLGLNPAVPEWCPEPAALLERAKAAGAEGVWTDPLHLSKRLADRISDKGKAAVTLPLIQRAQQRRLAPEDERCAQAVIDAAAALGMPSFSVGQWKPSGFFDPFTETYGVECLFPTMQDFLNACWEHLDHGDVLTFDDFADFFCPWLPEGKWPISRYIAAKFHDFLNENRVPSSMTYRELLAIVWSEPRFSQCPARLPCFAYAGQRTADNKGWIKFVDERGLPFLVFSRDEKGFDDYFAPAEVVPDIHGIAGESEVNILIPIDA